MSAQSGQDVFRLAASRDSDHPIGCLGRARAGLNDAAAAFMPAVRNGESTHNVTSFSELGLIEPIQRAVLACAYTTPTPI
ncbi:MAG: hypothetical protein ACFCVH_08595, partial [Alphaproteobacteria bacterium]